MDGFTFTQTKRAPFKQGALNVLPMHELTGTIAACSLCTHGKGEGQPGVNSSLMYPEAWRQIAEIQEPTSSHPQTC